MKCSECNESQFLQHPQFFPARSIAGVSVCCRCREQTKAQIQTCRNRFASQRHFQLDRLDSKRSRESARRRGQERAGLGHQVLRRSLSYTVDTYSIALSKRNIEALLYAAKISPAADRLGGTEKFFTDEFLFKALGK
jgi:hypothetical protein